MSRSLTRLFIPVLATGIFFSCEKQPAAPPPATINADAPDDTYTVRALVDSLPTPDGRQPLALHHEEIPAFKDKEGRIVGMKEMSMPFPSLAPGVSLDGLQIGDAVECTFEVRWNRPPRSLVTRLHKLPADVKPDLKHK